MAYRIDKTMQIADPFALMGGEKVIEEHLRVDIPASADPMPADRSYLIQLTETAIRHVSDLTGRNPVGATYRVHVPVIPLRLELPFRASQISAVEYLKDGETTYTSLNVSDFGIHGETAPAVLFSRDSIAEPGDTDTDHPFPFRFTIQGLADRERETDPVDAIEDDPETEGVDESAPAVAAVDQLPRAFVQACLIYLSHLYENRQAVVQGAKPYAVPLAFDHLVAQLRRIR